MTEHRTYDATMVETRRNRERHRQAVINVYGLAPVDERMRIYDEDTISNLVNFRELLKAAIGEDAYRAKLDFFVPLCPDHPLLLDLLEG